MAKQKLTYKWGRLDSSELEKVSVVDVLTCNDYRTAVYAPKGPEDLLNPFVGINMTLDGKPVLYHNGHIARAFFEPGKHRDSYYLIFADEKTIKHVRARGDITWDQDKVRDNRRYLWNGTFNEILEEFRKAGYTLECPLEARK